LALEGPFANNDQLPKTTQPPHLTPGHSPIHWISAKITSRLNQDSNEENAQTLTIAAAIDGAPLRSFFASPYTLQIEGDNLNG
jgi:hypothetical protein